MLRVQRKIEEYIYSFYKPTNNMTVKKFTFSTERMIASFKIDVLEEDFLVLVKESFWPEMTVVHEYLPRTRRKDVQTISLTSTTERQPKN